MPVLPTPPQEDPGTTGTAGAEYTSGRLASNDVRPSSSSSRCCLPSCFGRCKRRQAFADQLAGPTSAAVCILRSVRATAPQWGDPRRRWQRHGCDRVAIPSDMIPIGRDLTRMPISALTDMPSSVTSRSCPVAVVDVEGRDLAQLPRVGRRQVPMGGRRRTLVNFRVHHRRGRWWRRHMVRWCRGPTRSGAVADRNAR